MKEDDILRTFRSMADSKRRLGPLPKVLINSGNGPELPQEHKLGPPPEHWLPMYRQAWNRLSAEDQKTLADYVKDSGITGAPGLDVDYAAIHERVADGGPGWTPNPPPPQPAPAEPAAEPDDAIPAFLRRMAS
jgi:hypothetical protein